MFLSNRRAAALAITTCIISAAACSWPGGQTSRPVDDILEPRASIPFETKEPETFQADFVTVGDGSEIRTHYSRKGASWRFDSFDGEIPSRSIIRGDKLIHIDHRSKIYAEVPESDSPPARQPFISDLTTSLLDQKEHATFERIETNGDLEKYRVTVDGSSAPFVITYDTKLKMVVRQEFEGGFAFEMRQFNLEVDDAIFQVPHGYRKTTWTEFRKIQ